MPEYFHWPEGNSLSRNDALIGRMEQKTGLVFLEEQDTAASPVCLADSEPVRDEFRSFFTRRDLYSYIRAVKEILHVDGNDGDVAVPYPENREVFWKYVRMARARGKD
jgi:hypothetical protein